MISMFLRERNLLIAELNLLLLLAIHYDFKY